MSLANCSALTWAPATKPSPPAFDTAAARAGVLGPPDIGAPTIGTMRSQKPSTIGLIYHRPKLLRQRSFRAIRAQDRGAEGLAQQSAGDRVDLVEGDRVDLLQGVLDAAVRAVVQLAATDAAHPRAGILQTQNQPAA